MSTGRTGKQGNVYPIVHDDGNMKCTNERACHAEQFA